MPRRGHCQAATPAAGVIGAAPPSLAARPHHITIHAAYASGLPPPIRTHHSVRASAFSYNDGKAEVLVSEEQKEQQKEQQQEDQLEEMLCRECEEEEEEQEAAAGAVAGLVEGGPGALRKTVSWADSEEDSGWGSSQAPTSGKATPVSRVERAVPPPCWTPPPRLPAWRLSGLRPLPCHARSAT